ncbi:GntR family transcriptional regulator [Actinomycetes bacterium KLBMP 9759]
MYEVLLNQFMDGTRAAGEPLSIGALARELNVSQTPLREALARLETTGLVRREALKGYRVAPLLSRKEISKLFDARLLLEPALARETGLRTTPEFLDELREAVEDLERSVEHADSSPEGFRLYWTSDARLHALIAEQCDNPFLEMVYRTLSVQAQRFRLFSKLGHTGAAFAAVEHRAIYEALAARDADAAAEKMREHLTNSRRRNVLARDP